MYNYNLPENNSFYDKAIRLIVDLSTILLIRVKKIQFKRGVFDWDFNRLFLVYEF